MRLEAGRLGGTRRLTRAAASDSRSRCQWRPTAQPARGCYAVRGGHRASACARMRRALEGARYDRATARPTASSGYHNVIIGTCVCTHNSSTLSSSPGSRPRFLLEFAPQFDVVVLGSWGWRRAAELAAIPRALGRHQHVGQRVSGVLRRRVVVMQWRAVVMQWMDHNVEH